MASQRHSLVSMFARLSFYPSLAYNVVLWKMGRRRWFDRIDDNVILGALPLPNFINAIMKHNVVGVISMNEDYELLPAQKRKDWEALGVAFLQLPVVDIFSAPSQEYLQKGVDFIYEKMQENPDKNINDRQSINQSPTIYVHCKAGRTRSATLVACYLMKRYQMEPDEAIVKLKEHRPQILFHSKQIEAIMKYYEKLQNVNYN